jgi:hypothetical protein
MEAEMVKKVLILLGTKKGAFIMESDTRRRSWKLRGPFCETWPMNHVIADPVSGTIYAGGGDAWFGPAVWKSTDLGATCTPASSPPGCSGATTTACPGRTSPDCATIRRGRTGNPAAAG